MPPNLITKKLSLAKVATTGLIVFIFLYVPYHTLKPLFLCETWHGGHDGGGTVFNAWSIVTILQENFHLPLCWLPENFGYKGNPFWQYYQPLPYLVIYLCSIFVSALYKTDVYLSLKLSTYLSFVISELCMFFLLKTIFKNSPNATLTSIFGSLIYLFAPYRFIDLYARSAYSELWIFSWIPLYFLGFYKLFFLKDKTGCVQIAVSMSLLLLSHFMPSIFFLIILYIGFLIFKVVRKELGNFIKEDLVIIKWCAISNLIGMCISSFYTLPLINCKKYLFGDIAGFDGMSLEAVKYHIVVAVNMLNPLSYNYHWRVGQVYFLSILFLNFMLLSKKKLRFRHLLFFLNVVIFIAMFFICGNILWEHLPPIFYSLQFPWRLFVVYSFFGSLIIALIANEFKLTLPILVLILSLHIYTTNRFIPGSIGPGFVYNYYNIESWINDIYKKQFSSLNGGSFAHGFLPKTSFPVLFNFSPSPDTTGDENNPTNYLIIKPGINILSHKKNASTFIYELFLEKSNFIVLRQYFYPTWKAYLDSKETDLYLTDLGYIGVDVPKGKHILEIRSN
ncbi:MAG: hypothetical protein HYY52_02860 [Candidatus Melainabacteria bacterium]|nr:hypothetical protein [Candidatus Melainabacteria bacterium]